MDRLRSATSVRSARAVVAAGAPKVHALGESLTRALNRAAARDAELVAAGWVILHLTWSDLLDPEGLRRKLVRLVRHRVV